MSEYNDIVFALGNTRPLEITMSTGDMVLDFGLTGGEGKLPSYEGEYVVTPKIEEQTLETKNKSLVEDVTVLAIPYSEVTNPQGGETVNIAYVL